MKLHLAALLALVPLLVSSCQKDDKDSTPQPPTTNPLGKPAVTQAELSCRVVKSNFIQQPASGTATTLVEISSPVDKANAFPTSPLTSSPAR